MRGFISEIDVALARTGRTRDLWARNYLDLELSPEHRQTEEIRFKLFDHVCAHRKSVPAGLGSDILFLERVPASVAGEDSYQLDLREAIAAGRTIIGGLYVRDEFSAAIPVVSPVHYETLAAWKRPGLDSQKFGISASEQIELDAALMAYPAWVLQGYGSRHRACKRVYPELLWPTSLKKQPALLIEEISTSVNPQRFEPLKETIRAALCDPMVPPADGFYEPRFDTGFLPEQTGAKARLVNAVLGPRTFEEICSGKLYRTLCCTTADALSQERIEQFAGERDKLLVRTGEKIFLKKRDAQNPLAIIGASTLPISSSRTGPDGRSEWLGTTTLVYVTFLDPRSGASETLNGFAAVVDEEARERVKEKFFPGKDTDALVLAETREASRQASAVLRSLFPTSFHEVTSPVTGIDRIIDSVASVQNNDVPAFFEHWGSPKRGLAEPDT
jgi:hypothetical protein